MSQVLRINLAVDQKLPGDVVFTLEGIFTKTINMKLNILTMRKLQLAYSIQVIQDEDSLTYMMPD